MPASGPGRSGLFVTLWSIQLPGGGRPAGSGGAGCGSRRCCVASESPDGDPGPSNLRPVGAWPPGERSSSGCGAGAMGLRRRWALGPAVAEYRGWEGRERSCSPAPSPLLSVSLLSAARHCGRSSLAGAAVWRGCGTGAARCGVVVTDCGCVGEWLGVGMGRLGWKGGEEAATLLLSPPTLLSPLCDPAADRCRAPRLCVLGGVALGGSLGGGTVALVGAGAGGRWQRGVHSAAGSGACAGGVALVAPVGASGWWRAVDIGGVGVRGSVAI